MFWISVAFHIKLQTVERCRIITGNDGMVAGHYPVIVCFSKNAAVCLTGLFSWSASPLAAAAAAESLAAQRATDH
jgi:hypothetical protein